MPAGTIALTNNSTAVTGTGTSFTAEFKANDFIVTVVGGVTYTLGVQSVNSATSVTLTTAYNGPAASGVAWTAVPNAALVGITAQVAADVAKAIRGLNFDKANWQQVYSASGNITVTLPDGSQYSGPSWSSVVNSVSGKMDKSQNLNDVSNKTTALSNLGALPLSGGTLTGGLTGTTIIAKNGVSATSNGVNMGQQGTHLVWNEDGSTGKGAIVVNRGSGTGGFNIRIVNSANTVENANFQFTVDGLLYAPNGSFSVGGRVRAFSAVNSTYLEVKVDGAAKGINFFDSDKTLKEGIEDADEKLALDIIRKIRPVAYKFKDKTFTYQSPDPITGEMFIAEGKQVGSSHKYGIIAQEFEEILPEGVITNSDGKKSLDPLEQIGLLLTVCHSQQKLIDEHSEIIKNMGGRLKYLDGKDT